MPPFRPHVLGIDDAPFSKAQSEPVPIIGVMMEGATLVEGIAITEFPVDGAEATRFLQNWIDEHRWRTSLQAIVLGGITIAGLGLIDIVALAAHLDLPVIAVTRRMPSNDDLGRALIAAGLSDRLPILDRTPESFHLDRGLFATVSGTDRTEAERLVRATTYKAKLPEPLRIAHLVGAALVRGTSHGRV